jgi:hypothetical protein
MRMRSLPTTSWACVLVALAIGGASARAESSPRSIGANFKFDLSDGSLQGRALLGATYATVTAALGRPTRKSLRKKYAQVGYGQMRHGAWPLSISFRRKNGALRAWSIAITSTNASEVRLGRILRLSPTQIERAIARRYAGTLRLTDSYRCRRKPLRCRGEFERTTGDLEIGFGLRIPRTTSARYIVIYET